MHKTFDPLLRILEKHPEYKRLEGTLIKRDGPVSVFGLGEAHRVHVAAALHEKLNAPILILTANETAASRIYDELSDYTDMARRFPARDMPLMGKGYAQSGGLTAMRLETLTALSAGENVIVIASMEALMQRLAPKKELLLATNTYAVGDVVDMEEFLRRAVCAGYERVELTEGVGQICRRGGYIDVFPTGAGYPVRIEFFDDEIDTLRSYDPITQRSMENIDSVTVGPVGETPISYAARARALKTLKNRPRLNEEYETLLAGGIPAGAELLMPLIYDSGASLLDYFPEDAVALIDEPVRVEESGLIAYRSFLDSVGALTASGDAEPEQTGLLYSPSETIGRLNDGGTAMLFALTRSFSMIAPRELIRFDTRAANHYSASDEVLKEDILAYKRSGYTVALYAGEHAQRLADRLSDMGIEAPVTDTLERELVPGELIIVASPLKRGFEYPELKTAVIGEGELFGTARKKLAPKRKRPQLAFSELSVGDLVVHELHGVGRFVGVVNLTVDGVKRDYLHLVYADGDKLYIPTDQLDRVQKYVGGDEEAQKLSKLGSGEWQRTVSRTRESVKRLAFDLVKLYGERSKQKGFRFLPDNAWQQRLEESFPYEETPDQLTSIAEIKKDMESERVMDRLLCGDVGYGKTEVALRAAFKAVLSGKQAAFLVPTTILAQQHYNTLASRFSGFPVTVALLSRFNTPADEKRILDGIQNGSVDVVVGTHKLLNKNVRFKDLGLLIIDEEQRFGVGHKETVKNIRKSVDVLSLSATPIPRTLHMSMTGIRDMSVIETPPEQRFPVQTYVMEYSSAVAREAIMKELGRGGQSYFVYNSVRTMEHFAEKLRELVPEARIACAHGQMGERQLERTMLEFMDYQYDVLLCSTIIESGLDIQNVNTIIVYDADHMGLSQLYQLRGRVGRGTRLGYAYLTFRRDKVLTEIAEKRLTAIREFTQFGSGFKIAMRDLEIRGAGNLLGPEQSGHMQAVGYDLYCKLIEGAVKEAKGEPVKRDADAVMEVPIPASIGADYIPRETDRLSMYKRIAMVEDEDDAMDVRDELIDRFGDIPRQVENLIFIARLKADCVKAYITRLAVKDGEVNITFDPEAPMDGERLLEVVNAEQGARLYMSQPPKLVVSRKRADVAELCKMLPQFVYSIKDCIEA